MANVGISGSLQLLNVNLPTRAGQRIKTISEISEVPTPFIGMIIYIEDEDKFIYVTSLKDYGEGWMAIKNGQVDKWEYLNTGNSEGLNQLQLRVTTNEENIKTNTDNIAANATNIIQLNSSVDTLTTNLQTVQTQVDSVSVQLSVINSELTSVKNDLSTVNQAVIILNSDENTTGSVRYLIKEQINPVHTSLNSVTNELTELKSTATNNNQNIIQLKSNVEDINNQLQAVHTTLGIITNDSEGIDTLREVLEVVKNNDFGDLLQLEARVTTVELICSDIDNKIDTAFSWEDIVDNKSNY